MEIEFFKRHLHDVFTIKDLGQLYYSLGIEVSNVDDSLILTLENYTKELLQSYRVAQFKRVVTALPLNIKFSSEECL